MTATIHGVPFFINPTSIQWSYNVKLASQPTIGGMVVQLFGWTMGDLVISGSFGKDGIERQQSFFQLIDSIADVQAPTVTSQGATAASPVRFLWPEQDWDFLVFIRSLTQVGASVAVDQTVEMFAPKYTLTLFVYEDNGQIVKAAADSAMVAYMNRLSAGLGWKRSAYNGPMIEADLQGVLKGQTLIDYAFSQYGIPSPSDIPLSQTTAVPTVPKVGAS